MAHNVQSCDDSDVQDSDQILLTTQQINQLIRQAQLSSKHSDVSEESDDPFSGMISCENVFLKSSADWIMDSGATDHINASLHLLKNVRQAPPQYSIKIPTGATSIITHIGDFTMKNGLQLKNVLFIPTFTHNLLSIHKLSKDNNCEVQFLVNECHILNSVTKKLIGMGHLSQGLYYISAESFAIIDKEIGFCANNISDSKIEDSDSFVIWHNKLGHSPLSKIKLISSLKHVKQGDKQVCVICPLAKMPKLPYQTSHSYNAKAFDLAHIDTWGPYKCFIRKKFKYFLTLVDDHTRYL